MNGEEEQSYFRWMLADVHVIHCAVNYFGELKGASESSSRWQPEPSGVQCRPELGILRYVPTAAQLAVEFGNHHFFRANRGAFSG